MKFGIAIENLRLQAIIGILPFERENAQEIAVDLDLRYEIAKNNLDSLESTRDSAHDSCESIINYALLREIILDSFKQNEFFYLESALVAIQRAILKRFPQILELDLSVKKLAIFSDCVPKVRLSWSKELHCHSEGAKQPKNPKIKSDIFLDSSPMAQNDRLVGNSTHCAESSNYGQKR